MQKISLAIPTYFSSQYLSILLRSINKSEIINEIIISDDSNEEDEIKKIKKIIEKFQKRNKKIKIYLHENLNTNGAFNNKFEVISRCSNEIIYQIDSDNIPAKNIDKKLSKIIDNFDKEMINYPSSLRQFFFNYQYYFYLNKNIVNLSKENLKINSNDVSDAIINDKKITIDKNIFWILNSGNFIVSKDVYIASMEEYYDNPKVPLAADALAISYLWLKSGKEILLNSNLHHYHRKRSDSVSLSLRDESEESFSFFREKFKSL
tara:strand:- start:8229 stop:9017 length:789 start_codon:yes stop_codon:yes gene_type:complete